MSHKFVTISLPQVTCLVKFVDWFDSSWDLNYVFTYRCVKTYFLFSPLLEEMIQFDEHIFQMGWLKPPTRQCFVWPFFINLDLVFASVTMIQPRFVKFTLMNFPMWGAVADSLEWFCSTSLVSFWSSCEWLSCHAASSWCLRSKVWGGVGNGPQKTDVLVLDFLKPESLSIF